VWGYVKMLEHYRPMLSTRGPTSKPENSIHFPLDFRPSQNQFQLAGRNIDYA